MNIKTLYLFFLKSEFDFLLEKLHILENVPLTKG